jgi:hypothetical protein
MLKLSGAQSQIEHACEGIYRKQDHIHDGKPTYVKGGGLMAMWFVEEFGWCVGFPKDLGNSRARYGQCLMDASDDFAPTPDAVKSRWMVEVDNVKDSRVQVVLASARPSSKQTPVPASIPDPTSTPHKVQAVLSSSPIMILSVVGVSEGYNGLYERQRTKLHGRSTFMSTRADGNRMIWYSEKSSQWCIGPLSSDGRPGTLIRSIDLTGSFLPTTSAWHQAATKPFSSIRVTKSKKIYTKVVEVKGVPTDNYLHLDAQVIVGKYRQQARMIGKRPTFKGGQDGNQAIWYSESAGSWRISPDIFVGTAIHFMNANDAAKTPDTVKVPWTVYVGECYNPYANVIAPSVKAAKQEVTRQTKLVVISCKAQDGRDNGSQTDAVLGLRLPVHSTDAGGVP